MLAAARSSALRSAPELLTSLRAGWAASLRTSAAAAASSPAAAAAAAEVADPSHAARLERALDLPVTPSPSPWGASPSEAAAAAEIFRLHNSSLKVSGGHMIKARVLNVDRKRIMLDTGVKVAKIAVGDITPECVLERAAAAPGDEPRAPGDVRPGDVVQVYLEHEETPEGDMLVSGQQAAVRRRVRAVWRELQDRLRDGAPVKGRVLNALSGGYAVGVAGLVCFLPNSATTRATARRIGELQDFRVTQMNAARNNVVLADWRFVRGGRPIYQAREQQGRGGGGGGGGGWRQAREAGKGPRKERAVVTEAEGLVGELDKGAAAGATAPPP